MYFVLTQIKEYIVFQTEFIDVAEEFAAAYKVPCVIRYSAEIKHTYPKGTKLADLLGKLQEKAS